MSFWFLDIICDLNFYDSIETIEFFTSFYISSSVFGHISDGAAIEKQP